MSRFPGKGAKSIWPAELWQWGVATLEEESRLLELSSVANAKMLRGRKMPYAAAELYGCGQVLRRYGFYPAVLPLCVDTDHGPQLDYQPLKTELETDAPRIFHHNQEAARRWKKVSRKPCHVMSSPFVLYRRSNGVKQSAQAQGTLFFPAHSTPDVENRTEIALYIELLKGLPESLGPVAVCMYGLDVQKENHLLFLDAGIPVFTAGHPFDVRFVERFYDILRHFQFTASNELGSYAHYSVELGIPFSLRGPEADYWNHSDRNETMGPLVERPAMIAARRLFAGWHQEISAEQREFALALLGQNCVPSRLKIGFLLYLSFFQGLWRKAQEIVGLKKKNLKRD